MVQLVLWGRVDLQSPRRLCWSVAAKRRSILLWVGESLACFVVCFVYFFVGIFKAFFVVTSPQWNIPRSQCNNGIAVGEGWDWWDFGRPLVPPHRWGVSKRFIATAVLWGEANFVSARGRNTRVVWLDHPQESATNSMWKASTFDDCGKFHPPDHCWNDSVVCVLEQEARLDTFGLSASLEWKRRCPVGLYFRSVETETWRMLKHQQKT